MPIKLIWPTAPRYSIFLRSKKNATSTLLMNFKHILAFVFCLFIYASPVNAQQRLQDPNTVVWAASLNTVYLAKHVSVWAEYQWRREDFVRNWQQSMPRVGLQYHFNNGVSVMAGYAHILTFPYGEYPAGPHKIPEHRIFEQVIWNGNIGRVGLNHRLRLEQRFLGKVDQKSEDGDVTDWIYVNRLRYQLRMTIPLNHSQLQDKTWYILPYDEIFIGFGPNVNQNIFDQNRAGLMLGYNLNKVFKIEGGLFNQTLQQGGLVAGKEVIQYNSGFILNVYLTKPFGKKAK